MMMASVEDFEGGRERGGDADATIESRTDNDEAATYA
jgi:hypothetical protein